ncbi:glycoside hydrolase family 97 protein [Sphingomonas astaxanthinifaciens]|uniref:Alpha-glucosidase n=1 Tax=Sphingomonas astaxanthinifaciens DSM 22298 TaxID=1123267 RepID=A0ABQ5Z9M5_9SPHN|nr:glycoside hydrolase family 97 protein [Sphingomonas astaxanthinifaciens]GLR48191.1 alpha-glucosidase [Sphingomonas astaxanthinifaciens DSM 22298]
MRFLLALLALVAAVPAFAQSPTVAQATSPSGVLKLTVTLNGEGRIGYAVSRGATPVIAESHLGFLLTDGPQLLRNFELRDTARRSVDETWQQPWGEWRNVRDRHEELALTFQEKDKLKRTLRVRFRIFDDAVAFRYEMPEQSNLKTARIAEELTQFQLVEPGEAWWAPAFESNREEYLYNHTPIDGIGTAQTPFTMKTASGLHVAIHEAALVDYSGMNIARVQGGLLKAVLTPSSSGAKVVRDTPFETPWRVILVTADAPALYRANTVFLNLNEPNKLGDVSWVRPRRYMGIWWGMHLDTQSWATGPKHGATTAYAKKMIDFAAKNGFTGLLVEGWNKGWDGDWFATGDDFSFTEATPDFDIKAVAAYGLKRGVHLIGHHETSANIAHYESQLEAGLDFAKSIGEDTIKTGYVADAGGVQAVDAEGRKTFEWHEGQVMSRHHLKVVTEAAKRHIAINAHEPIKDTGLRRTYPNWISREGQRGMEYNAWGVPKNPPGYDATLVFTRMLGGPMDFTPGILSLMGRGNTPIPSTLARQLAYYVVLYSPIQMAADLPENYEANAGAFQFIKDVATDWDDTRMLAGDVGQYAVFARKERGKPTWFMGGLTNEEGRDLDLPLTFLDAAARYRAEIYRDGDGADFRTNPRAIAIEKKELRSTDRLKLRMAPGGGFAIRLVKVGK